MSGGAVRLFDVEPVDERPTYRLNLVGAGDIARALGLTSERIRQLTPTMPAPAGVIHRGTARELAVWEWPDIEAWAGEVGRPVVVPP